MHHIGRAAEPYNKQERSLTADTICGHSLFHGQTTLSLLVFLNPSLGLLQALQRFLVLQYSSGAAVCDTRGTQCSVISNVALAEMGLLTVGSTARAFSALIFPLILRPSWIMHSAWLECRTTRSLSSGSRHNACPYLLAALWKPSFVPAV